MAIVSSLPFPSSISSKLSTASSFSFPSSLRPSSPSVFSTPISKFSSTSSLMASPSFGEDLPLHYGDCFPTVDPAHRRRAGILLHPTSFRVPYGIGDLGEEAFHFIDWLHEAGCSVWQVLPLVPSGEEGQ